MDEIKKILEQKMNTRYGVKTVSLAIKDVDEGSRKVSGYFSSFDTIDSDMDVIRKGAFAKSIQEIGPNSSGNRKIAHLRNHDWDWQIGKILELEEDSKGLRFVSQLGTSTKGEDALRDYQEGILREHSIGFNYVSEKIKFIEESAYNENGHWEVTEVKLWEGSGVTFGANSLTPVIEAAKFSGNYEDLAKKITEMENAFIKAIRTGKGSDERGESLEARYKQIQELRNSLMTEKPSLKDTLAEGKPSDNNNNKSFYQNLL